MRNIREIKKEQELLLKQFHAKNEQLEQEIKEIRKVRGTKLKEPGYDGHREVGRDREQFTPWG
jgi:hypothetical protein